MGIKTNENHDLIAEMRRDEKTLKIIEELKNWPGIVLSSHKSAGHPLHKLVFLADLGFKLGDPGIEEIVEKVLAHKSEEGVYQCLMNIPVHFGGTGEDQFAWAPCDAPLVFYALVKFGVDYELYLKKGVDFLFSICRENGWPCSCSKDLGKFRGPGRKEDSCPYANLIMLKLASAIEEYKYSHEARSGVESILNAWEKSKELHAYMFFMGTDFRKLKAPLVWYDILNVTDTLSRFDFARRDPRFLDMLSVIREKPVSNCGNIPESIWKSWSEWDFGQKKVPSAYLTYLVQRVIDRVEDDRNE